MSVGEREALLTCWRKAMGQSRLALRAVDKLPGGELLRRPSFVNSAACIHLREPSSCGKREPPDAWSGCLANKLAEQLTRAGARRATPLN